MLGVNRPECNGRPRPTAAAYMIAADSQPGKFVEYQGTSIVFYVGSALELYAPATDFRSELT